MAKKVQIDFIGNVASFDRAASHVTGKIKGIADLGGMLKTSLIGALGGLTIGTIVSSMSEFAKSIDDASKGLSLTIQETYQLKRATLEAGMSFESMFKVRSKAEAFLQKVVDSDADAMRIASKYGITGQERWNEALTKMLTGRAGIKDLTVFAGKQAANFLSNPTNQQAFLDRQAKIDEDAVMAMANFKTELELLTDEIKAGLLPAMGDLISFINKNVVKPISVNVQASTAGRKAAAEKAAELGLEDKGAFFQSMALATSVLAHPIKFAAAITSTKPYNLEELYVGHRYGEEGDPRRQQVIAAAMEAFKKAESEANISFDQRQKAKQDAARAANEALKFPPEREPSKLDELKFGTNPFLQIGGLMGVDINARMLTLTEQIAKNTDRIAMNTEKWGPFPEMIQTPAGPFPALNPQPPNIPKGGRAFSVPGTTVTGIDFSKRE